MNTFVERLKSVIMYGNTRFSWFMIGVMSIITMEDFIRNNWIDTALGVLSIAVFYSIEREVNVKEA